MLSEMFYDYIIVYMCEFLPAYAKREAKYCAISIIAMVRLQSGFLLKSDGVFFVVVVVFDLEHRHRRRRNGTHGRQKEKYINENTSYEEDICHREVPLPGCILIHSLML